MNYLYQLSVLGILILIQDLPTAMGVVSVEIYVNAWQCKQLPIIIGGQDWYSPPHFSRGSDLQQGLQIRQGIRG